MRFSKFREFRGGKPEKYLSIDLSFGLKELFTGLSKLTLTENFEAFEVTVTIEPTSELKIRNELKVIPSSKIILRDFGINTIVDGDTDWTQEFVYLKNTGAAAATAKVLFLR